MDTSVQLTSLQVAGYEIIVQGVLSPFMLTTTATPISAGVMHVQFSFSAPTPQHPEPVTLMWRHPMINTHLKWHPGAYLNRTLEPNWNPQRFVSRGTTHAPVYALYGADDTNALTFALSDTLNATLLSVGLVEETAEADCQITLFYEPLPPIQNYTVTLRLDTRAIHYTSVLADVSTWWADIPKYKPTIAPVLAAVPLYSTWYSFHQNLSASEVEYQCQLAKDLGMGVVIVDDGWQTHNNERGYAYCGDWNVNNEKFPDFAKHVAQIHQLGMKYVMWFAVPFLGIHSEAYPRFKDKVLDPKNTRGWYVLDPRFPEVRSYLINIYRRFALDYRIDGFKLDFVDAFLLPAQEPSAFGNGRDYDSVPEAVDRLLTDVTDELRRINPDILIEFRQSYIGPLMRKYGNMLRAGDVPDDITGNRVRTLDVRLLAGNTPVHADMLMWHPDESVESAAMQIIHALFAVPQISVLLDKIPPDHLKMVRFYLDFWSQHVDVILNGQLQPQRPGYLYPLVCASSPDKTLLAFYGTNHAKIAQPPRTLILVNGTFEDGIVLDLGVATAPLKLTIQSCTGEYLVKNEDIVLSVGAYSVNVPKAGVAILSYDEEA
ncbi:MAG: alpha-galactosidase [Anaerolineae bacterium]|nr:alpha-galactosidase [Anaerolineae bacterium]